MRYVRPLSLTWWAGVTAVLLGAAQLAGLADPRIGEAARLIVSLSGGADASPAGLILLGLGLIGLRDRIERGFRGDA